MTKPNLQKRYQAKKQNVLLLFFPFLFNLSKRCFCSAHLWSFLVFSPPAHSHPGAGQRLRSALQTLGLSRACPPSTLLHPPPPDFKKDVAGASADWSRYRSIPSTGCVVPTSLANSDFEAVFSVRVGGGKVCPPSIQNRILDFLPLSSRTPPPTFLLSFSQGVGEFLSQTREGRLSSSLSPSPA